MDKILRVLYNADRYLPVKGCYMKEKQKEDDPLGALELEPTPFAQPLSCCYLNSGRVLEVDMSITVFGRNNRLLPKEEASQCPATRTNGAPSHTTQ